MFLVDFVYDERQSEPKTSKFNSKNQILRFVADNSIDHENFKLTRINKYENGRLTPYAVTFDGRLNLVQLPLEEEAY